MAEWWIGGRWKGLLELIDGLPEASRFRQAMALDREVAAQVLEARRQSEDLEEWAPPLSEWTTQVTLLAEIRDLLPDVVQAILSTAPRKPGTPAPRFTRAPFPRPRTALDEVEQERSIQVGRVLLSMFFSSEGGQ